MNKIKDILMLDLQDDIKNVIDLEDHSEQEIKQEIESYIVTEGIARHLDSFTNQFTGNIKETGVWLSGFYGSGKSYFGKMLGYILENPMICGTPARDRFIPRLKGVKNDSLIENSILNLGSINSRVILLDVAKQNTDKGLAFTLFANLLKTLGFRDDLYGYMEFDLYIDGKYDDFKSRVKKLEGNNWDEIKKSNRQVAKVMRSAYTDMGFSKDDYDNTHDVYSAAINDFSANKFKDELEKYLKLKTDEVLVFIFDEASEAISQEKFTLLDLEGISESLSSISNKVWTIAIAQEKLDDVINNANVNRSQLTKVTDRFKTKIHLESTEVDVIIRSRLLQKKASATEQLIDYYKNNEGLVADATNLNSAFPTKTTSAEDFAIYYPFHKYQFSLLQRFLFSSTGLATTQIAARGMIITTFDVLRKQMQQQELYSFTPGYAICTEAQTAPPADLNDKYDTAHKILLDKSEINGRQLLKTIHLLTNSEAVAPTVENITKSYISDITSYYAIKPKIEAALNILVEAKTLLYSNNSYKITSDLEGKLLEEMNDYNVELFARKRSLINHLNDYRIFNSVATFNDGAASFKFNIFSDQDDILGTPGNKQLRLMVYSLFNTSDNRQDFIEQVKITTQYDKDLITLIPNNKDFAKIDKLLAEVSCYSFIEEKYSNETDNEKRLIIRNFAIIREEKEKELRLKIEQAYHNASIIYMFDEYRLDDNSFKTTINKVQQKLVKNIYTKRLTAQLSESLVAKIFNSRKESLNRLFTSDDFKFFDKHGNFTGDHLKVVEELNAKIQSRYADGRTLEGELSGAPWGYAFGTIVTTLAALFRAGRLSIKYNGETWFSYTQQGVHDAFTNATKFRSASFKSIINTLTATQKSQAVQLLMALEIEHHTGRKVDWNINDFDLADSISCMADHFTGALATLNDTIEQFSSLFPTVADYRQTLQTYAGKVTESNYIEKVEYLLTNSEQFNSAIQAILKTQKFIKNRFSNVKEFKRFIEDVISELKKADQSNPAIHAAYQEFMRLYQADMVKNFALLQQQVQLVKDSYYSMIKSAATGMSHSYQLLNTKVESAIRDLKNNYPAELNAGNLAALVELKRYCSDRIVNDPVLEWSITCKHCGYSLSDIINYTALAPNKESELMILQSCLIKTAPATPDKDDPTPKAPRKVILRVSQKNMTAGAYRTLLTQQIQALNGLSDDDKIRLEIE